METKFLKELQSRSINNVIEQIDTLNFGNNTSQLCPISPVNSEIITKQKHQKNSTPFVEDQ